MASGRKASKPPRLPHLTALQAAAGKWGWSAEKTLETAQALYDVHKVATYPRSDGKHLPEAQIPLAAPTLAGLAQIAEFAGIVPAEPVIRRGASGAFSDKALEGSSHHAIIPNPAVAADFGTLTAKLSKDERRLFDLIARSFIAALSPDHAFDETVIEADVGGETFRARGRVVNVDA